MYWDKSAVKGLDGLVLYVSTYSNWLRDWFLNSYYLGPELLLKTADFLISKSGGSSAPLITPFIDSLILFIFSLIYGRSFDKISDGVKSL